MERAEAAEPQPDVAGVEAAGGTAAGLLRVVNVACVCGPTLSGNPAGAEADVGAQMDRAKLEVGAVAGLPVSSVEPAKEGLPDGDRAEAAELQQVAGAAVATALLCRDCGVHFEGARFRFVLVAWAAGVSGGCGPHKC